MTDRLDQRQLPGISRLYADYLSTPGQLADFYPAGPAGSIPALLRRSAELDLDRRFPAQRRRRIADLLAATNREYGAGPAAFAHLDLLARPGTVAVVAGQQAGLFGGPLLTLYKALTAIRLAEDLRGAGCPAVPIFWLASQDHDLAEINQAWLLDSEGEPRRIEVALDSAAGRPVGEIEFGNGIEAARAAWAALAGQEALAWLRDAYHPGATFASAFARLMAQWFEPWGLIMLDPLIPGWAELGLPLYLRAFDGSADLRARLARRESELIARGYHAQVTQAESASLLFFQPGVARQLLRRLPGAGERWLCGDESLDAAELRRQLAARPDRISPSALLRPLLQDTLLPTLCQISGPAETAYLAQTSALAEALATPSPLPWPRASLTLTDARARRLLVRYGLQLESLFQTPAAELLARAALDPGLQESLARLQANLQAGLEDLLQRLERNDPTLLDAARTAAAKIRHQSDQLAARIARSIARRDEDLRRHAAHLAGLLFPRRELQERVLNSAAMLARFPQLLPRLHAAIEPQSFDHLVVSL